MEAGAGIGHMKELGFEVIERRKGEYEIKAKRENFLKALLELKGAGFATLLDLTAVDWINEKEFELIYHVANYETGERAIVKVRIDRENAEIETATGIYPLALNYEREVMEMFGIRFIGHPYPKKLILEGFPDDIHPLRKDFDTRRYSLEKYGVYDKEDYPS